MRDYYVRQRVEGWFNGILELVKNFQKKFMGTFC